MIRQNAFTGNSRLLKGALHCHTTRSDGKGTPEEVMRLHKEDGYDFMAITDHRIYNKKSFAPETGITVIPGMEIDRSIYGFKGVHCFHTVVLGSDENNPYAQDEVFQTGMVKDYTEFQPLLDEFHASSQITLYCHPEWSNTPAREFENLKGNFAFEIWNTGCAVENELDTNASYWDELLMQGKRLFGCATDDGHAMSQHCVGYVRVNAENNVNAILKALSEGAFYSSCGPEIYDFYVEDGKVTVKCSPCASIVFRCGQYPCPLITGDGLTEYTYKFPDYISYIRVTVKDKDGKRAWSNPIFLK